jgi:hypothetical protein
MGLGLLVSSRFHDHTHLRHTTVGRTPLDEGPARRRDLYLTTHNTHKRQTSMSPVRFEPTILVSERPKTHALDRTATGIGCSVIWRIKGSPIYIIVARVFRRQRRRSFESNSTAKGKMGRRIMRTRRRMEGKALEGEENEFFFY